MEQLGRGSTSPPPLEAALSEPSDLALLIGHVLGELPPLPSGSRVQSIAALLEFMRKAGVNVGSEITSEGVAEKELVTAMKLTWRLAYHGTIKVLEPILRVTLKDSERQVQKAVMEWVGKRIGFYPNVNTRSMSSDFADGLLFCALLHKQNSKSIKWQVLDKSKRETNLEQAFRLYQELYKIPRLLDVEDMLSCEKIDKRALLIYIGLIITTFAHLDPVNPTPRGGRRDLSPTNQIGGALERNNSKDKNVISPRSPDRNRSPPGGAQGAPSAPLATALMEPYGKVEKASSGEKDKAPQSPTLSKLTTQPLPESLRFTGDQLTSVLNALSLLQQSDPAPRVSSEKALQDRLAAGSPPGVLRAQSEPAVSDPTPSASASASPPTALNSAPALPINTSPLQVPPPEKRPLSPGKEGERRQSRREMSYQSLEAIFHPPSVSVSPPAVPQSPLTVTSSDRVSFANFGSAPVAIPVAAPPPSPVLSSSFENPSLLEAPTTRSSLSSGRPKSITPPTELQRQMIDFSRAVASLVKELRLAAPEADMLFDATRFARALNETVKSCRALVLLLPPEPNRRRVLSEAMMALSQAGRRFVDATALPDSSFDRAPAVEQTSREFGQAIQTLAALVRSACQTAGARSTIDENYLRETEERVRAYLKSFSEACRKVLALAAVRPVSAVDHAALAESLDALLRLGKTYPGQNSVHIDSLLGIARVAGLTFSSVAKRGEGGDAALAAAESDFSSALETAIQATKASLSAEVQGARRTLSSSALSSSLGAAPQPPVPTGSSIARINSSEKPPSNSTLPLSMSSSPTTSVLSVDLKKASLGSNDQSYLPNITMVSPRSSKSVILRSSAPDTPLMMQPLSSRQRMPSDSSINFNFAAISKEISAKSPLTPADVYRCMRSVLFSSTRLLQDSDKKEDTELLDLTMSLSTAAQELIAALKADPADASRTRTQMGRFLGLLKAGAERYSPEKEKEDKCSICNTKLTEKESESVDRSKSVLCAKCAAPLGTMQNTFEELMRSVQ